ncbi:MAG: hypothetical protein V2I57_06480 [Xanthomonadales bacterium]|jgi:uncharacterized paraquat-inducible protein A|nr:hypothetical protein [Xanthomonadales bacterium]
MNMKQGMDDMNVPGTIETRRSSVTVCSECYTLMRPGKNCCPECGENLRRRQAWERVMAILVTGLFTGALVYQVFH